MFLDEIDKIAVSDVRGASVSPERVQRHAPRYVGVEVDSRKALHVGDAMKTSLAVVGHFDVPKIPAEVKNLEVTFEQSTRSLTGGDIHATHLWKLELPAWSGST